MATTYRYGQAGVAAALQHGRRGGFVTWNDPGTVFQLFESDNSTPANIRIAAIPVDNNDAASKSYVDGLVQGLASKDSVRVSTTSTGGDIPGFVAGTITIPNSNATYFPTGASPAEVDGVVLASGNRVLVKDQAATLQNGIYEVTNPGVQGTTDAVLTRAADADSSAELGSAFTFIEEGATHANQGWVTTFDSTGTVNTDAIPWVQFSAAGSITASNGVQLVGSDVRLDVNGLGNIAVVASDEITFFDTSGSVHGKRLFSEVLTDLSIVTESTLTGGRGINVTGPTVSFDNSSLTDVALDGAGADTFPYFDASNGNQVESRSFANMITDLGIRTGTVGVTTGGTGLTTVPQFSVMVANTADTITALAATDTAGNQLLQWNDTTNLFEFVTTSSVGGNSYGQINLAGNTTGDANVDAANPDDEINLTGGAAITLAGNNTTKTVTIALTDTGLTTTNAVVGTDTVPFFNAGVTEARSFANILADLDIVTATANGVLVRTAADTYASRTITASATASEEGIVITNGDGVAGNPTIGVDVDALTARTDAVDGANDTVLVFNASSGNNEKYTINDIASASSSNSFETWTFSGNQTGDASLVADSSTDTISIVMGDGLTATGVAATDTVTLAFSRDGLADTAVVGTDTIPFFDASNTNTPEFRSFANLINDLDIVTATADGMLARTAADTYASRTITASVVAGDEGISIVDGNGVAGNPTIGVDVTGLTAVTTLATTDEFLVYNGTNNRKIAFSDLADEVSAANTGIKVIENSIALVTGATTVTIPNNARVVRTRVVIDTVYDNSATIAISATTSATNLMPTTDNDTATAGIYETDVDYRNTGGAAETITFTLAGGPTVGAARLFVEYYEGSAI